MGLGALAVASWEIVPLVTDLRWLQNSEFNGGTFYDNSFGVQQALSWLFAGQLYDNGRLPVVSVFVAIGIPVCLARARRSPASRAVLATWLVSLVFFFGRGGIDAILNVLPMGGGILHRYIIGIHYAGLLLAGAGAAWTAEVILAIVRRTARRRAPQLRLGLLSGAVAALLLGAFLLCLWPAWSQIAAYDAQGGDFKAYQLAAGSTDGADYIALVERARALGDGRIYSGTRGNWGAQYKIGYVQAAEMLQNLDVDAIGFTLRVASMLQDAEARFDEHNLGNFDVFNVRYMILPADHPPPVPSTLIEHRGRHTLWRVQTTGYFAVVDTIAPPISANGSTIGRETAGFMESDALTRRQFPTVVYNGVDSPPPTLADPGSASGPAGVVQREQVALSEGIFGAQVVATRPAAVLLKSSFDPRFVATVDGADLSPYMVAPGMPAVSVPAGVHSVEFRYVPYPYYPLLFVLAAGALVVLEASPRLLRRWRHHGVPPEPAAA